MGWGGEEDDCCGGGEGEDGGVFFRGWGGEVRRSGLARWWVYGGEERGRGLIDLYCWWVAVVVRSKDHQKYVHPNPLPLFFSSSIGYHEIDNILISTL